jgi:hypothetical protein
MEAEYNAVTCVAIYILLMSFSQKGIDKLRNYQEHLKMRHPEGNFHFSEGFDDGKHPFLPRISNYLIIAMESSFVVQRTLPQVQRSGGISENLATCTI